MNLDYLVSFSHNQDLSYILCLNTLPIFERVEKKRKIGRGRDIHAYMDMIMSMLTLSCSRDMHPLPREEENLHICGKVLK